MAPCSSAVYSLLATVNSVFASQLFVSPMAVPSLTASPFQQPFVVGPGYSPIPFQGCFLNHCRKVRESGRFISRKHYHSSAGAATLIQWPLSVVAHA